MRIVWTGREVWEYRVPKKEITVWKGEDLRDHEVFRLWLRSTGWGRFAGNQFDTIFLALGNPKVFEPLTFVIGMKEVVDRRQFTFELFDRSDPERLVIRATLINPAQNTTFDHIFITLDRRVFYRSPSSTRRAGVAKTAGNSRWSRSSSMSRLTTPSLCHKSQRVGRLKPHDDLAHGFNEFVFVGESACLELRVELPAAHRKLEAASLGGNHDETTDLALKTRQELGRQTDNSYICPSGVRGPRRMTRPDGDGGEDGATKQTRPRVVRTIVRLKPDLLRVPGALDE